MALSLESASLVRQKVYNALGGVSAETENHRVWWNAAREVFNGLARKGIDTLQFVEIDATTATTDDGQDFGIDAAHQVYFVYVKKAATATDSYLQVIDDADNDSEVPGDVRIVLGLLESGDEAGAIYPEGLTMADGLVATFATTPSADSATQSAAADAGNGFIVIGA